MKHQYTPIEPGNPETDFFYYNTPDAFHTRRAFELISAAEAAGFLSWICTNQAAVDFADAEPDFSLRRAPAGPLKTRAQLAYWCKKACSYLGLNRGSTTWWEPFEDLFGKGLKGTLHDMYYNQVVADGIRQEYATPVDAFFETLNTSTGEDTPTNDK